MNKKAIKKAAILFLFGLRLRKYKDIIVLRDGWFIVTDEGQRTIIYIPWYRALI